VGENNESYDMLKLKNQLCFPLYACAREVVKMYKPFLDKLGLTYTQYIAMMVLWEQKSVSIKTLGRQLYLDSGTLTPLLKRMESDGLVSRERDPADERSVIVTLTDKGERLREQAVQIPAQVAQCLPLALNEAKQLYDLLYKVLEKPGCVE
jgi:DNA-binding MarR family transcriptional regulator